MRLDLLLVGRGLCGSRTLASRLIRQGFVTVNGKTAQKSAQDVSVFDRVELLENHLSRYVSRGGLKLEKALDAFGIFVLGKTAFDFGASTGGFCDCLLSRGVRKLYAVDVGTGQLHETIRTDVRVVVLEQTDARALTEEEIDTPCDLGVMDVAFISQALLYPAAARFLKEGADLITLFKPQFEVGRENVGKGGIVRKQEAVQSALSRLICAAQAAGLHHLESVPSPIRGADGNEEILLHFRR